MGGVTVFQRWTQWLLRFCVSSLWGKVVSKILFHLVVWNLTLLLLMYKNLNVCWRVLWFLKRQTGEPYQLLSYCFSSSYPPSILYSMMLRWNSTNHIYLLSSGFLEGSSNRILVRGKAGGDIRDILHPVCFLVICGWISLPAKFLLRCGSRSLLEAVKFRIKFF